MSILGLVSARSQDLHVPWHMQPAQLGGAQRMNVIYMMNNISLRRQRYRYVVKLLHLRAMDRR